MHTYPSVDPTEHKGGIKEKMNQIEYMKMQCMSMFTFANKSPLRLCVHI